MKEKLNEIIQLLEQNSSSSNAYIDIAVLITADIPDAKWILNDDIPLSITGLKETREKIIENKPGIRDTEDGSFFNNWGCLIIALVVTALMVFGIIYLIKLF